MARKNIKQRIKEHFFLNPSAKLRLREIERALDLPFPSVLRYSKELFNEGILSTESYGNVKFYTAKREEKFLLEKKLFNLKQLYDSGMIDFLREKFSNPSIVVFGSYSRGEDIEDSDIDIYLETPSGRDILLDMYEEYLNRKIQLMKHKSIKEVKNMHLANNIINGIILNGHIEVF